MESRSFYKLAKKESTLRKVLPVAGAIAAPLAFNAKTMGVISLPVLAGLGSTVLQRKDAHTPFLAPLAGAYAGRQLGAHLARKHFGETASGKSLSEIGEVLARSAPKSRAGATVLGATLLGGALGAYLGNKR